MAGVSGRSGQVKRIILTRVMRLSLSSMDADLLPFFEMLEGLPAGRRNAAMLAAIRGGAAEAGKMMTSEDAELAEDAGNYLM